MEAALEAPSTTSAEAESQVFMEAVTTSVEDNEASANWSAFTEALSTFASVEVIKMYELLRYKASVEAVQRTCLPASMGVEEEALLPRKSTRTVAPLPRQMNLRHLPCI